MLTTDKKVLTLFSQNKWSFCLWVVSCFGFVLWKYPQGHLEAFLSDKEGQIIYNALITHEQYSITGNECISGYSMIILLGKLESLLWDKAQQTVVNETLIELSKHHLYQQANR